MDDPFEGLGIGDDWRTNRRPFHLPRRNTTAANHPCPSAVATARPASMPVPPAPYRSGVAICKYPRPIKYVTVVTFQGAMDGGRLADRDALRAGGVRDRLQSAQDEDVGDNADDQHDAGNQERAGKGLRCTDDVARRAQAARGTVGRPQAQQVSRARRRCRALRS
jgi:hypothetical protein